MSLKINIDNFTNDTINKIDIDLRFKIPSNSNFIPDKIVQTYDLIDNDIYIPFSYGISEFNFERPKRDLYPSMNVKFQGELREEQKIVKKEALQYLNKTGCIILSCNVGFGKTALAINMSCNIKLKTLIIVNKIVLMKQWEESILKFCPDALVQKLTTKSKLKDCDFYIMNAINVAKMGRDFFKSIGNLLLDECHLLATDCLSTSLQYITPRYLIALSATPYRFDDYNKLISLYFGKNQIIREMKRDHIVYKINTGIKIELEKDETTQRINWGKVLKEQSSNEERNQLIIKIIQHFKDRIFMVLCKRVEQANYLLKKLQDLGENVDGLIGSKQEFDDKCRILISIQQKTGTGFDWPKADTMLLATDTSSYFIQNLGRVFRKKDTIPIIFDLIDDNFILLNHFKERAKVYNEVGGKIVSFNKKFPDFI